METDERTSSIEPAGVMATACTQRRPEATREAPAEIVVGINWQLARDRPGRRGWRRGWYDRGSRVTRLAGDPALLTRYFQIQEGELKKKAVTDPRTAVAVDVASLRAISALPGEWLVSGLVNDVATGLIEIVVPPAPIRSA